jgi:hypothetical protein
MFATANKPLDIALLINRAEILDALSPLMRSLFSRLSPGVNRLRRPATTARRQASKRIPGIIPSYRSYPSLARYEPLTIAEKFKIASEDAFDRGTFALAALFAGEAQLTNANRSFGQRCCGI